MGRLHWPVRGSSATLIEDSRRNVPSPGQETPLRGAAFPSTRWSLLRAGGAAADAGAARALDELARLYWRPIAAYARSRWVASDDEAREVAQDFFVWVLESGFLARADRGRGSFRGFVKRALARFLADRERARRTAKRGGTRRRVPFEGPVLELADDAQRAPDELLDDLWRKALLAQAVEALERDLRAREKELAFEVFRDCVLADEDVDHRTVAARHGITPVDVMNRLAFAKERFRAHLRAAVAATVGADDELRAELAWLLDGRTP